MASSVESDGGIEGPLKATSDAGSSPHILEAKILHVCSLSAHFWAKFGGEAGFISAHFLSKILGDKKKLKNLAKFGEFLRPVLQSAHICRRIL
jgi:hypothetical protein